MGGTCAAARSVAGARAGAIAANRQLCAGCQKHVARARISSSPGLGCNGLPPRIPADTPPGGICAPMRRTPGAPDDVPGDVGVLDHVVAVLSAHLRGQMPHGGIRVCQSELVAYGTRYVRARMHNRQRRDALPSSSVATPNPRRTRSRRHNEQELAPKRDAWTHRGLKASTDI
mgnify:CR=1 FL=1